MSKEILVVEDDDSIAQSLAMLLESEGYQVSNAENGKMALEKLQSGASKPCLILLDLMMPVMDGFEFRNLQQKDPAISSIPAVVMTADGNESKRSRISADAFLKKPLDIHTLLDTIQRFCS